MGWIDCNPEFRELLSQQGFHTPGDFLHWNGVVINGHPNRSVHRVALKSANTSFILKKEQLVSWRERLHHAWQGFGWSSRSVREARTLIYLRKAGVLVPKVVAHGEVGDRAFLLLEDRNELTDLATFLTQQISRRDRCKLARYLGAQLARIHQANCDNPDLFAKHLLVGRTAAGFDLCVVDWQRSTTGSPVDGLRKIRDLAALDATLTAEHVDDRFRLLGLRAYLRGLGRAPRSALALGRQIRAQSEALLDRRKIREMRAPNPPAEPWLLRDEGRVAVSQGFQRQHGDPWPDWLDEALASTLAGDPPAALLVDGVTYRLHRFNHPEHAAEWVTRLARLSRFGVRLPKTHAFGRREQSSWILVEVDYEGVCFEDAWSETTHCRLTRALGGLLRKFHQAGYILESLGDAGKILANADQSLKLVDLPKVQKASGDWQSLAIRSWPRLLEHLPAHFSQADRMRLFLGYCQEHRLTPAIRPLARRLMPRHVLRGVLT